MIRIEPLGDRALLVTLVDDGARIDAATSARVRAVVARLGGAHEALTDVVPAYASVAVHYDPARVRFRHEEPPHDTLARSVAARLERLGDVGAEQGRLVEIPVRYGSACDSTPAGRVGDASFTALATWRPSTYGIRRSVITTAYGCPALRASLN